MPYDEGLAERQRKRFSGHKNVTERKMFGSIAFMLSGNQSCGALNDALMARVGPDQHAGALKRPHARRMDFTRRRLKGFVQFAPEEFESNKDLAEWVRLWPDFMATLPAK